MDSIRSSSAAAAADTKERDRKYREAALKLWAWEAPTGRVARCNRCGGVRLVADIHVDHIIPLADGGLDVPSNWQLLCVDCHKTKTKRENSMRSTAGAPVDSTKALKAVIKVAAREARKTKGDGKGSSKGRDWSPVSRVLGAIAVLLGLAISAVMLGGNSKPATPGQPGGDRRRVTRPAHGLARTADHAGVTALHILETILLIVVVIGVPTAIVYALARMRHKRRATALERTYRITAEAAGMQPGGTSTIRRSGRAWHGLVSARLRRFEFDYPGEVKDTDPATAPRIAAALGLRLGGTWRVRLDPTLDRGYCEELESGQAAVSAAAMSSPAAPGGLSEAEIAAKRAGQTERITLALQPIVGKGVHCKIIANAWDAANPTRPADLTLTYGPQFATDANDNRERVRGRVAELLPYQRWSASWDTGVDQGRFTKPPDLPELIPHPGFSAGRDWNLLPFATDANGAMTAFDLLVTPHVLVVGSTGAGKTSLMRSLAVAAINSAASADRDIRTILLDPKKTELSGFRGWPGVTLLATTSAWIWDALIIGACEMRLRYAHKEAYGTPFTSHPVLLLIIDELYDVVEALQIAWQILQPKGVRFRVPPAIMAFHSLIRMGRACGVHVVAGTQRPDADVFGAASGGTAIRDFMRGRAAVGPTSQISARMVFEDSSVGRDIPDKLKGRCTVQIGDGAPFEAQSWWTPDPQGDTLGDADRALLARLRPADSAGGPTDPFAGLLFNPDDPDCMAILDGEDGMGDINLAPYRWRPLATQAGLIKDAEDEAEVELGHSYGGVADSEYFRKTRQGR